MRLHRLTLQAFGPFAGEQCIDFDRLSSGGLFLLDGPTGAGKSTVLDAITFALYGQGAHSVSGGDDRLHSHFAAAGTEPRACLEFSVGGIRHRVTRTPEFERPKKRGAGTTTQAATVHLERCEGGAWVTRSSNKAEVADQLAEVIGLTRAQFTQVVLLPQGEFATFLRAGDDERRALLTKLFGTHLYDRITDELRRREGEAAHEVEAARVDVQAALAAAAEAAGLSAEGAGELRELTGDALDARLDEVTGALDAQRAADERARAAAGDALAAARAEQAAAAADADRRARHAAARTAWEQHGAGRAAHEASRARLADARRADPVRPLLTALADADEACAAARTAVLALGAGGPDPRPARPGAVLGVDALGVDALGVDALGADALAADALADRAAASARAAAELQHLVEREAALPALAATADAAAREASASAETAARLAARQAALPAEIEAADAELNAAQRDADALDAARRDAERLGARLAAARELAQLGPQLDALRDAARAATDEHQHRVERHQRLLDARLAGIAAELAAGLADGEPCPVCGAADHPAPALAGRDLVAPDDVAAAAAERDAAQAGRERATAAVQDAERRAAAAAALAGTEGVAALQAELDEVSATIARAEAARGRLVELTERRRRLADESAGLARAHAEATAARATAEQRLAAARAEHAELDGAVRAAAAGHADVASRQGHLLAEARRFHELAEAVRAASAAVQHREDARRRAAEEAAAQGFADLDRARAAVLDAADQGRLTAEVETWAAENDRLTAALGVPEFADLNAEPARAGGSGRPEDPAADAARVRVEHADRALGGAERTAADAADRAERSRHAAERFADRRADLTRALARLRAVQTAAEPVAYLAKLTRGMAGRRRVNLTTYVLRHWFERVVQAANLRLGAMSSGRYELVRVDDLGSGSRVQRTGLTLRVLDRHTGEQRSTNSLSGGETFYTSLALALGLADVVKAEAGGADLDTLFIDEGFGSLDTDTLEEVMSVIDDLRDRGRVVGIVSHVGDLKDRIAERVEVRRRPDGSSELRVVA